MNFWRLSVNWLWKLKMSGGPVSERTHTLMSFTSKRPIGLSWWRSEKTPLLPPTGRGGKVIILKYTQGKITPFVICLWHSILLSILCKKSPALKGNYVIKTLSDPGKGQTISQWQPLLVFQSQKRGKKSLRNSESHSPGTFTIQKN